MRLSSEVRHAINLLALGILAIYAYSNSFDAPFVFDGVSYIIDNPIIKDMSYFTHPFKGGMSQTSEAFYQFKPRFIAYLSFALNYKLGGLDPRPYHALNLLIHIASAMLLYSITWLTLKTPKLEGSALQTHAYTISALCAMLFVAHPVQVQAITYVVQRFASMAGMFTLAALAAYIFAALSDKGVRRCTLYAMSLITVCMAMLSKQSAFTAPVLIIFYDLVFLKGGRSERIARMLPMLVTMVIVPLTMMNFGAQLPKAVNTATVSHLVISRHDYFISEFRVIITYLKILFYPVNLMVDYDYPVSRSLTAPGVLPALGMILILIADAFYLLYQSRRTIPALALPALGIIWFFIALSVESSVFQLDDLIFEHRLYLPSAGIVIAAVSGLFIAFGERHARTLISALIMLACVLAVLTHERNELWRDPVALWRDNVQKAPGKVRPHHNLAVEYDARGMKDDAIGEFNAALAINPKDADLLTELGLTLASMGRMDEAMARYKEALASNPSLLKAHVNLGVLYYGDSKFDLARKEFEVALRIYPFDEQARMFLAEINKKGSK